MSSRLYFICGLRFDGRRLFFLWFRNEHEGIERTGHDKILTFPNPEAARAWTAEQGLSLAPDPLAWYDFDTIAAWCDHPTAAAIDCNNFLNAWNLLGDLHLGASSIFSGADRRGTPIYDKLFFGNNLPSITPAGQSYAPVWSDEEVRELALRLGLAELRARLTAAAA